MVEDVLRAEQAAGKSGRESEARRGEEAGDSAQALHASPILDSAGSPAAQHSLSAAGAAPGALIGSQRPGAGEDRLMRVRAPRPLGEPPSGRRRGGGERAGKERKGKGRAVGEGRGARGAGRGPRGRGGGESPLRAKGRAPAGKDPACPGCLSLPRGVPATPTRLWKLPTNRPRPPPLRPSGWIVLPKFFFRRPYLQTPELPEEILTHGNINFPFLVGEPLSPTPSCAFVSS